MITIPLPIFSMILALTACAGAGSTPAQTGEWNSPVLNKALKTELFLPAEDAPGGSRRGRPAIIYLKNLNFPRVGKEPDDSIIADLLKQGYLVMTIDYGKDPKAVAPHINFDLRMMRKQLGGSRGSPGLFGRGVLVDNTYILPEGYRLLRDVVYYEDGGDRFRMDIRYPSKADKPMPAVMQIPVDNASRMGNGVQVTYNEVLAEGFLTRGYAAVQVDNPIRKYAGVDYMPDIAYKLKAAVRTVRAKAKQCNIDSEHIGVMGFSRGSGQAGILAMSGGVKEYEKGPNLEYSSRVQAALLHAGRMDHLALLRDSPRFAEQYVAAFGDPEKNRKTWEMHSAISYLTKDDPPTFLSVGGKDEYRVKQIELMAEALKRTGVEYRHAVTPNMGHQVTGDLKILGEIYDFFDKHLKPAKSKPPQEAGGEKPSEGTR